MARDTPDESVPLELIIPGNNTKRGSLVSSRFVDLDTAEGLSNGHSNGPVHKPLKLKNLISKGEAFDTLHQNSNKRVTVKKKTTIATSDLSADRIKRSKANSSRELLCEPHC
ncbi:Hypothetical protein CINCED_3A019356 [Cinara cedri]|uniref:Uncharacterized protein n=1 Tax=Cinara cedri TaxID=506608 RepID=A0A5E4NIN2_9HEMI|nr:Hypothetical protein CINCED_3A019356 [Cinara cedri]